MTALLRAASPGLQAILGPSAPGGKVWSADLFGFTLIDGTPLSWTGWDADLTYEGVTYSSKNPWLTRTSWSVTNTMEVATLTLKLRALDEGFGGGAQIKQQIVGGLFDGAAFLLSRAFMTGEPGALSVAGTVALFGGVVGGIVVTGTTATITVKAKVNILDQNAPRNLYQVGCNHAFCDAGCTLSRASFTADFTAGATPTASFIPWASAPSNAALYQNGTITFTSGAASGQTRSIDSAGPSGLALRYPLYETPGAGDAFSAFQGCDKTFDSGSGQSCTDRNNTLNFRGYPYVPPPNAAY